jgi:hypothetical protein
MGHRLRRAAESQAVMRSSNVAPMRPLSTSRLTRALAPFPSQFGVDGWAQGGGRQGAWSTEGDARVHGAALIDGHQDGSAWCCSHTTLAHAASALAAAAHAAAALAWCCSHTTLAHAASALAAAAHAAAALAAAAHAVVNSAALALVNAAALAHAAAALAAAARRDF